MEEPVVRPTRLQRFNRWRQEKMSNRQFVLVLSFLVGVCTAVAAWVLKSLIHHIQYLLTHHFAVGAANLLYLLYPMIGILLTIIVVKCVVKDDISHGVTKILYAISRKQGRIKRHNIWSSVVASSLTIGFGGSVGAESPIVLTGSAIGSNMGNLFKMDHRTLMLLIGCGAAAAIAGIFKAPIAGVVFTLEVLMIDLTMTSLLPLLVSTVTAATITYLVSGQQAMFSFHQDVPFVLGRIPFVIALGVVCGLLSLYFTRTTNLMDTFFGKIQKTWVKWLIGGIPLSLLIFLFPPLYGEGYDIIELLISGNGLSDWNTVMDHSLFYGHRNLLLTYLVLIVFLKVFAMNATNGAGGCGGMFAPSLFIGCIGGFAFSHFCNDSGMFIFLPEKNFALMGMAGLMSGVMHAPLTGVFLIAELTGGYQLFLPLLIVSMSSYLTIIIFEPHSVYATRLAKKGELLTHNKDRSVLTLMNLDNMLETDFLEMHPEMDLGRMVSVISKSRRNIFPVTDAQGMLLGVIKLDDIRRIIFRQELYHRFTVERLMTMPEARIRNTDSMEEVMRIFDETKAWNLPVVDKEGRYLGFLSRSKLLNSYRNVLVDFSDE